MTEKTRTLASAARFQRRAAENWGELDGLRRAYGATPTEHALRHMAFTQRLAEQNARHGRIMLLAAMEM